MRLSLISCLISFVTYINILGQQVVGGLVLLEEIAVGRAAGQEATEKEAEKTDNKVNNIISVKKLFLSSLTLHGKLPEVSWQEEANRPFVGQRC
jgi:hypothetical protein